MVITSKINQWSPKKNRNQLFFSKNFLITVKISRVTSRDGLKILINDKDGQDTDVTSNVVYREVFRNVYDFVL